MCKLGWSIGCALLAVAVANADIIEWGGASSSDYSIAQVDRTVEILAPGTYKFEAVDGLGTLENINRITIDPAVTGLVTVHVARDPAAGGGLGAADVKEVDLTNAAGVTGDLAELRISGALGAVGSTHISHLSGTAVILGNVLSPITIEQEFEGSLECASLGDFSVVGPAKSFAHNGNLTVNGDCTGDIYFATSSQGRIQINGDLSGTLTCLGALLIDDDGLWGLFLQECSGAVSIQGDARYVLVNQDISGSLSADSLTAIVYGSVTAGATVTCGSVGVVSQVFGDLRGTIAITNPTGALELSVGRVVDNGRLIFQDDCSLDTLRVGTITGTRTIGDPAVRVDGALNTTLQVLQDLENVVASGPEIVVGSFDTFGAVAVDYDGYHSGDRWEPGATIVVNSVTYSENTPSARVYEIQRCRGDMNNDGWVNDDDVTPYYLTEGQYVDQYPGLYGSWEYHKNTNCGGGLTGDDDTRFEFLVTNRCCTSNCVFMSCAGGPGTP